MNYNSPKKYKSDYYAENRESILAKQAEARKKARKKKNDHESYMRLKAAGYYDRRKPQASLMERIYAFFLGGIL